MFHYISLDCSFGTLGLLGEVGDSSTTAAAASAEDMVERGGQISASNRGEAGSYRSHSTDGRARVSLGLLTLN